MPRLTPKVTDFWMVRSPEARRVRGEVEFSYDLPGRPESPWPTLPKRLTAISDDSLMDLLAEYNRWADHVGGQLFLQEIDERYGEEQLAELQAKSYAQVSGKSGTDASVTRAKALRDQDPEVEAARSELRETYARRKALQWLASVLDSNAKLLSREITRRVGRSELDVRAERHRT
jgi:hypothetical protein